MLFQIAGSSPIEIDYKRQLRAEQWARFCGRHSCAELIEKWSRTRNLDKESLGSGKDQGDNCISGRARANSAVQSISKVNMPPIKSDKGNIFFEKFFFSQLFYVYKQNCKFSFQNRLLFFIFRNSIKVIKSLQFCIA